jgi:starvation-inducible DNA-binding protein
MFKTEVENVNIGLSEQVRREIADNLFKLLSDTFVLYVKALNYHWNVVGTNFTVLHEFFQKIYEELNNEIDDIAERIRALGFKVPATLKNFLSESKIEETNEFLSDKEMIRSLLDGYEKIINDLRGYMALASQNKDESTASLLSDLIKRKEKVAWMLRALLE